MNLTIMQFFETGDRVPRVCGDEPVHARGDRVFSECSPRVRG